jgi:hypothetical protein
LVGTGAWAIILVGAIMAHCVDGYVAQASGAVIEVTGWIIAAARFDTLLSQN